MMMRILMIIDGLPGGGAEKTVLTLARGMTEMGHHVSVFSLRRVCDYTIPEGVDYQVVLDTCRKPWRKLTELSRRARLLDNAIRQAERESKFDLIFSHLHKTDRIVAHSKVIDPAKLWFCIHGMFSFSYLMHRKGFAHWLKRTKIRRIYQNSNVVAVSKAVLHDLTDNVGITLRHSQVIHNPFDIETIQQQAAALCEMEGQPYLIHVGRFHHHKRHDRLLHAFAQSGIKDASLVLMGNGSEEKIASLASLAEKLNIADRVIFKPFAANPYPWIRNARLLALSSDCEGFGNVLVEAIICGTPVVSTNCPGGPKEIMTGELARGLSGMEVDALAQTLTDIYHNPPVVDRDTIVSYGVDAICRQYLSLISR